MSVETGAPAIPFALPCKPSDVVDVGDLIGKEKIVLLFFPLAFSPVCSDEMCSMRDGWQDWDNLNARVFGVCVDSPFVTEKFRTEMNVPFPILSDFNKEVARSYDVIHEDLKGLKGIAKRSAIVIDAQGVIVHRWVTDDPTVQAPLDEIRAAVEAC